MYWGTTMLGAIATTNSIQQMNCEGCVIRRGRIIASATTRAIAIP